MALFGGSASESAAQQQATNINLTPTVNFSSGLSLKAGWPLLALAGAFVGGLFLFRGKKK